jgi:ferredoxin
VTDLQDDTGPVGGATVTFQVHGRTVTTRCRDGVSLLRTARMAGLRVPSSCEAGTCATCIAQVVEGSTHMRHNEALTPEEVAEGWVLTCQAVPTSPTVSVVYE